MTDALADIMAHHIADIGKARCPAEDGGIVMILMSVRHKDIERLIRRKVCHLPRHFGGESIPIEPIIEHQRGGGSLHQKAIMPYISNPYHKVHFK